MEQKASQRPITVEAFRFIHLKSPEIFKGKTLDTEFINHPSPKDSAFLNPKDKAKKESFSPYISLQELRNTNTELYSFMFWLRENKSSLDQEKLAIETEGVAPLDKEQRFEIWDNLFYQTQINSSQALVEGLIRMLQADHFLMHYKNATKPVKRPQKNAFFPLEKLRQVAKANVIIPNQLFEKEQSIVQPTKSAIDHKSKSILSNKLDMDILQYHIDKNQKAVEEITTAESTYAQNNQAEYESAYQAHQDKVSELKQAAQEVTNEVGTIKICGEEIEPFTFHPKNTWDDAYLKKSISPESLTVYQSFKTENPINIADTRAAIETSLSDLSRQRFSKAKKTSTKTLVHKGIRIPLRNHPLNNSYVFKAVALNEKKGLYSIYVTQYFENQETKVRKIEATVSTSEKIVVSDSSSKIIAQSDTYVTLELFSEGIVLSNYDVTFDIKGLFQTENRDYSNKFEFKKLSPNTVSAPTTEIARTKSQNIPIPNVFGVLNVKVAVFKKVNQTLCCYTEGEVSHIENILAREYKERSTRNLIRTELTTEEKSEKEVENLSDTTSTDRHEMQTEASLILQEDKANSFGLSASVGGSYSFPSGGVNFNTSGSFNTSSSSSSSSSFNEAESYAKELTERAMKRLVEKTSYKRTSKMVREFEENNKHGFDNREGEKHVTGVYRWVDKIYKNELVNYGKRLMYEFMLPEPAKNYKHLLVTNIEKSNTTSCDTTVLEAPIRPDDIDGFNIKHYTDVKEHNYSDLAAYYNIGFDEDYPAKRKRIAKSFSEDFYKTGSRREGERLHCTKSFDFEIDEGYQCIGFKCKFSPRREGTHETIHGELIIGNRHYYFTNEGVYEFIGTISTSPSKMFDPVEKYLPISLTAEDVGIFGMTIWAECELKSEVLNQWKARFHAAMWKSYHEMLQRYNDALYEQCLNKKQDELASNTATTPNYNINPLLARTIEKREIKRLIIELIMERIRESYFPIGFDFYEQDSCNNTLNINTGTNPYYKTHVSYIKFLENAFDWDIMAYAFFPYYWASEHEWGELLSIETSSDHIFLAFLQAGMSNIVLPVKAGLEKSVAFLLETGKLWNGDGFVLDGQDDLYPAIEENLQIEVDDKGNEIKYDAKGDPIPVVEASWETRIPTTLTIVQDYSNPLDAQGLPCFCDDNDSGIGFEPNGNYNQMSGKKE